MKRTLNVMLAAVMAFTTPAQTTADPVPQQPNGLTYFFVHKGEWYAVSADGPSGCEGLALYLVTPAPGEIRGCADEDPVDNSTISERWTPACGWEFIHCLHPEVMAPLVGGLVVNGCVYLATADGELYLYTITGGWPPWLIFNGSVRCGG